MTFNVMHQHTQGFNIYLLGNSFFVIYLAHLLFSFSINLSFQSTALFFSIISTSRHPGRSPPFKRNQCIPISTIMRAISQMMVLRVRVLKVCVRSTHDGLSQIIKAMSRVILAGIQILGREVASEGVEEGETEDVETVNLLCW